MQPVGGEHLLSSLFPHEREQIDPPSASPFGFVAGDLIEAFDLPSDKRRVAEPGAGRGHRPIRLWQRDHARIGCTGADPVVDRADLTAVAIIARSLDDVVRADEQRDERRAERRNERQLFVDEIVGRVSVHGWVRNDDGAAVFGPEPREDRGKRSVRCRARADGERVAEREESFGNGQLF